MNILDPFEKIIDTTMDIKDLVEIFKDKDIWFKNFSIYLESVIQTMNKYIKNRNPKKDIYSIACDLLQNELDEIKGFLEKEKNRSSISSFFLGLSMVKESQYLKAAIEKQIIIFFLVLGVDNHTETTENFKAMLSAKGLGDTDVAASFKNPGAADMWVKYFYQDEQVSWSEFSTAMINFA